MRGCRWVSHVISTFTHGDKILRFISNISIFGKNSKGAQTGIYGRLYLDVIRFFVAKIAVDFSK